MEGLSTWQGIQGDIFLVIYLDFTHSSLFLTRNMKKEEREGILHPNPNPNPCLSPTWNSNFTHPRPRREADRVLHLG
ncbi:hypothetical protein DsansV1_C32g0223631 [Dioscorea sansibarensis]